MSTVAAYDRATLKVGLEIHVELATHSRMWTSAANVAHPDFDDAAPNTLVDPVVIGMPGTLPVMNRAALDMSIMVGLALNCQIARRARWDRKSYYYPDLPKNYQISQYDHPICGEGVLTIPGGDGADKTLRILRAHLEEDAGKLLHEAPGGLPIDDSIVDLNRAGTPLLEIVTYPDFDTPEDVVTFGQMLRQICRHLGVTQGVMQKGHMRFEPNINVVIERGGETFATPIVEIKNLNSFKAVDGAIRYEYERQIEQWLETGAVMGARAKSTRGWDDVRQVTTLQREKEDSDEYRYFPDPDLVDVVVDQAWLDRLTAQLPPLPHAREQQYVQTFGLEPVQARTLIDEPATADYFEAIIAMGAQPRRTASFLLNAGLKLANDRGRLLHELGATPAQIQAIFVMLDAQAINARGAETLLQLCCDDPAAEVDALARHHELMQMSDSGELETIVRQVIEDPRNARAVADLQGGKDKAIGALMGQVMRATAGKANAGQVTELIRRLVGSA